MATNKNLPGVSLYTCILFPILELEMQQHFSSLCCASVKLILVISLIRTGIIIISFQIKTFDQEDAVKNT